MRGSVRHSMILLFAGCLFSSMGSSSLGVYPNAYIQLYNENQSLFMKTEQCGEVQYTIGLLTAELKVIQAMQRGTLTLQEAQEWLQNKENEVSLLFQIEIPSKGYQEFLTYEADSTTYEERVVYYAFGFQKDILLIANNKLPVTIGAYHFERTYGMSAKGSITLQATLPKGTETLHLYFNDHIYGKGQRSVAFDLKKIASLPKLKAPRKWKKQNV